MATSIDAVYGLLMEVNGTLGAVNQKLDDHLSTHGEKETAKQNRLGRLTAWKVGLLGLAGGLSGTFLGPLIVRGHP